MKYVHWGILMLLVLVVPFLLGLFPTSYMKKQHKTITFSYVCGWFVIFSSFELVAIPFIFLQRKYQTLILTYGIILLLLLLFSCIKGKAVLNEMKNYYRHTFLHKRDLRKSDKLMYCLGWIIFLALVCMQVYMAFAYEYYDGDDSYYLAIPVLSDKFQTMYLRDPYTGYNYPLDSRHAFAPTPLLLGFLGKVSGIHPTIVAHSVVSIVWLLLMYFIYMELSKCLLRKSPAYRPWFLTLLAVWYTYGNVTISTAETFIMTRTWQGKGLLAGVIIPCLFLCFMFFTDKEIAKGAWMLFIMAVLAAALATSVSLMLVPTMSGLAFIFIVLFRRKTGKRRSVCRKS